jgi:hypothetical protein
MKRIDINNLSNNYEEFVLAKIDIENYLLETNKIEEKIKLVDFLKYLDISTTFVFENKIFISFAYYKTKENEYLIYANNSKNEELSDKLLTYIEETIKYVKFGNLLDALEPLNLYELLITLKQYPDNGYFIINNETYARSY